MSSNYPAGVTGREPQIAGNKEIEMRMSVWCDFGNCPEWGNDEEHDVVVEIIGNHAYYDWYCETCMRTSEFQKHITDL